MSLNESELSILAKSRLFEGVPIEKIRERLKPTGEINLRPGAVLLELRNALIRQGKTLQVSRMPQRLQALVTLYGVAELLPA